MRLAEAREVLPKPISAANLQARTCTAALQKKNQPGNPRFVKCYPGNRWKWSKQLFSKKTVKKKCTRTIAQTRIVKMICTRTCAQTTIVKMICTRTCAQTKTVKKNVPDPVPTYLKQHVPMSSHSLHLHM